MSRLIHLLVILELPIQMCFAQLWQPTGGGMNNYVHCLYGDTTDRLLYVGGYFDTAGTTPVCRLTSWNEATWNSVGMMPGDTACPYYPYPLISDIISWDNFLMISGVFYLPPYSSGRKGLIKWDGATWTSEDTEQFGRFQVANGQLFSLGTFTSIHGIQVGRIIKWNDSNDEWERFCDSLPFDEIGWYMQTVAYYQGKYYLGGNFHLTGGFNDIAAWNGTNWDSISGGIRGATSEVTEMQTYAGQLFVAGLFYGGAGNPANHLIAWNGTQFYNPFPYVYFVGQVHDLDIVDGVLYIAGAHQVWDGQTWSVTHSLARYDGSQFCSFGGPYANAVDMEKVNGELYIINNNATTQSPFGILTWLGGDSTDICISQPVSIPPTTAPALSFSLFPNPGNGQLSLQWQAERPGPVLVEVHDVFGRNLLSQSLHQREGSNHVELDLGHLPPGTYMVRMVSAARQVTMKYVKV